MAAPQGCLERIEVTLSGPHYRPGPGSKWWLEVDGRVYADDVGLSESAGRRLADGDRAEVLLWEGRPVVIEPSPGERVETDNWSMGELSAESLVVFGKFTVVRVGDLEAL